VSKEGGGGMTVVFVESKNCCATSDVSWSIVMIQGPIVVAPLVCGFALDVFPQSPQNVAIEFSLHSLS